MIKNSVVIPLENENERTLGTKYLGSESAVSNIISYEFYYSGYDSREIYNFLSLPTRNPFILGVSKLGDGEEYFDSTKKYNGYMSKNCVEQTVISCQFEATNGTGKNKVTFIIDKNTLPEKIEIVNNTILVKTITDIKDNVITIELDIKNNKREYVDFLFYNKKITTDSGKSAYLPTRIINTIYGECIVASNGVNLKKFKFSNKRKDNEHAIEYRVINQYASLEIEDIDGKIKEKLTSLKKGLVLACTQEFKNGMTREFYLMIAGIDYDEENKILTINCQFDKAEIVAKISEWIERSDLYEWGERQTFTTKHSSTFLQTLLAKNEKEEFVLINLHSLGLSVNFSPYTQSYGTYGKGTQQTLYYFKPEFMQFDSFITIAGTDNKRIDHDDFTNTMNKTLKLEDYTRYLLTPVKQNLFSGINYGIKLRTHQQEPLPMAIKDIKSWKNRVFTLSEKQEINNYYTPLETHEYIEGQLWTTELGWTYTTEDYINCHLDYTNEALAKYTKSILTSMNNKKTLKFKCFANEETQKLFKSYLTYKGDKYIISNMEYEYANGASYYNISAMQVKLNVEDF